MKLIDYLREKYPESSRTAIKQMLEKGRVQVNGEQRTAYDFPVEKGDKVILLPKTVSIARASLSDVRDDVAAEGVKILF